MRRCFSNQNIYVKACNVNNTSLKIYNTFADITLDPLLTVNSATLPFTSIGNNVYRFQLDSLAPGQCKNFSISTTVSCNASLNQTLCLQANIFPVDTCSLDTIPNNVVGVSQCNGSWDFSHLKIDGECIEQ